MSRRNTAAMRLERPSAAAVCLALAACSTAPRSLGRAPTTPSPSAARAAAFEGAASPAEPLASLPTSSDARYDAPRPPPAQVPPARRDGLPARRSEDGMPCAFGCTDATTPRPSLGHGQPFDEASATRQLVAALDLATFCPLRAPPRGRAEVDLFPTGEVEAVMLFDLGPEAQDLSRCIEGRFRVQRTSSFRGASRRVIIDLSKVRK